MSLSQVTPVNAEAVTPSDAGTHNYRAIYVGASGNVKIDTPNGATVTLVGLAAGVWHPVFTTRIHATGTTATSILGGK